MSQAAGLSGKIMKDPTVPGRVIYKVDADRSAERISGKSSLAALAQDTATKDPVSLETITVNQDGERKSVPFETLPSYNRIGTVAIKQADGTFELRLRSEYEYAWATGNVKFQYTDANGTIYEKTFMSLASLYTTLNTNDEIILEKL